MKARHDRASDRTRAALTSLSAIGAATAGFGVGVLFARQLGAAAWPALVAGVAVHLVGMVGLMRLNSRGGYQPSMIEMAGYWVCWAIIVALLGYAAVKLMR